MKHIIDGVPIELRWQTRKELQDLVTATAARMARADEELESLLGEIARRDVRDGTAENVLYLFGPPSNPSIA